MVIKNVRLPSTAKVPKNIGIALATTRVLPKFTTKTAIIILIEPNRSKNTTKVVLI